MEIRSGFLSSEAVRRDFGKASVHVQGLRRQDPHISGF